MVIRRQIRYILSTSWRLAALSGSAEMYVNSDTASVASHSAYRGIRDERLPTTHRPIRVSLV